MLVDVRPVIGGEGCASGLVYVMQGVLERLAVDASGPAWLLTASSRGHLTLWDMRFQLAVNSFQQPQVRTTSFITPCISRLGVKRSRSMLICSPEPQGHSGIFFISM